MFFSQVKGRLNQVFIGIRQRDDIAVEPCEEAFQRYAQCLGRLANSGHGVRFFLFDKNVAIVTVYCRQP